MSEKTTFTVKELEEIYEDFMENAEEPAPEAVRIAHKNMVVSFDNYLAEIQESLFRQAFKYGYAYGCAQTKHETPAAGTAGGSINTK